MIIKRLRDKLLLSAVSISLTVALAAMLAVALIVSQQYLAQSNALLRKAAGLIDDSLANRKDNLLTAARQLASQKNLGSTIWYLTQYARQDIDRDTLLNTYLQLLRDTLKIGRVAKLAKITIYDAAGNLVAYATFGKSGDQAGFIEPASALPFRVANLKAGEELNGQAFRPMSNVAGISYNFAGPLPGLESADFALTDEVLAIESHVPIMGESFDPASGKAEIKQLGLVAMSQPLDQAFVEQLSRLTDIKINIFTAQGLSSGNLPAYRNPDRSGLPAAPNPQYGGVSFNEISIDGMDYYQGLMPLQTGGQYLGAIAGLQSKDIVRDNIKEMLCILGLIAVASQFFIFPFAWYFANSISRPLSVLNGIFRSVAGGKQTGKLSQELGQLKQYSRRHDEFSELTQSFIDMNEAINQKISEINEINATLEIKVNDRTAELKRIAHYDALTGIPNRILLADRMRQAIAQARREQKILGVCYLDIDGFKPVNDSMGHQAGDMVLVEIASRIRNVLREADTIARLGGDEFVVLLPEMNHEQECIGALSRILEIIALPFNIQDKAFSLSASIGVTLFPADDNNQDIMLRHADQAMYIAKQSGKNCYHFFNPQLDQQTRDQHETKARIQQGLDNREFELFYQPVVKLASRRITGAEALIRWHHPQRGVLLPGEFLNDIRHNPELEVRLGRWVIDNALRQLAEWYRAGFAIDVSVNIVASHLQSPGFAEYLENAFAAYPELPAGCLNIEILETAALEDFAGVSSTMASCRQMRIGFALDDFGTGYSSLTYLHHLSIDTLKIDQSFIRDMLEDKGDKAIVQGIIAMAKVFELKTVAEGIETLQHFDALLAMGCEYGQGYAISRPLPAAVFAATHRNLQFNPET